MREADKHMGVEHLLPSGVCQGAQVFPLQASAVDVLQSPDEFFQTLKAGLASAQRSITIATLYIGTEGGREAEFVDALAEAAHDAARPHLHISVLLDALRSTRPVPGGSYVPRGTGCDVKDLRVTSTAEMLAQRLMQPSGGTGAGGPTEAGAARVSVSLFHTPALRGLLRRVLPPRVREVVGVFHAKLYIFDDDVLLSGANISSSYLENRQDRYMLIRSAPELASFLREAVDCIAGLSYQLHPAAAPGSTPSSSTAADGSSSAGSDRGPGSASSSSNASDGIRRRLLDGRAAAAASSRERLEAWLARRQGRHHRHLLHQGPGSNPSGFSLAPPPAGPEPGSRQAWLFSRSLRERLLHLFVPPASWQAMVDVGVLEAEEEAALEGVSGLPPLGQRAVDWSSSSSSGSRGALGGQPAEQQEAHGRQQGKQQQEAQPPADTWILPVVQAGFAGLRQEERCTLGLLAHGGAQPGALLQVSTPYLNLARPYERQLAQAHAMRLQLLTSSPEANGFFGSRGVSGYIPLAYSTLEHRTWQRLTRGGTAAGATGAAAGGWRPRLRLTRPQAASRQLLEYNRQGYEFHAKGIWYTPPGATAPVATVLGSSNFGFRSLHRDLEVNFLLCTRDRRLQGQLAEEWAALARHAAVVADSTAAASGASHFLQPGRRAGMVGRAAVRMLRSFL